MGGAFAVADAVHPGFELEFVDADGVARRGSLASCWQSRFEQAIPARSFPSYKGQGHFPGWWWSSTTGDHVGYESWLERDHAMSLDYDPTVVGFSSQPFWLHWRTHAGGWRKHAPDYFARRDDGGAVVVDVRADDRIEAADAEAFTAMARACRRVGWTFRRVGVLEPALCRNLRWISRYRHPRCYGRDGVADRLVEVFDGPVALWEGTKVVGDPLEVLPVLYHLMWRQVLTADLEFVALGRSTVVGPGPRWGR